MSFSARLKVILALSLALVAVQFVNVFSSGNLVTYGIIPRTVSGLQGIVFAPFIHGSFRHLLGNLLPSWY